MAKEDILFYKKIKHKSPRSAYFCTVTPYGCDEVLFCPPRGDKSQKTIISQAAQKRFGNMLRVAGMNRYEVPTRAAVISSGAREAVTRRRRV